MSLFKTQKYLYAYTTPSDSTKIWKRDRVGIGLIKIGQTSNSDVEKRIREQLGAGASDRTYTLLYQKCIGDLTDKTIHKILKNSGVSFIENSEWAECSVEELEHAVTVALNGGTSIPSKNMDVYNEQNIQRLQDFNDNIMTTMRIAGDLSERFKHVGLNVPSAELMEKSRAVEKHLKAYYKEQEAECRRYWSNYYKNHYKDLIDSAVNDLNNKITEIDNIKELIAAAYCGDNFLENNKNFLRDIRDGMRKRDLSVIVEGAYICNTLGPVFDKLYKELRRDLMNNFSTTSEWDTGKVKMRRDTSSTGGSPTYRFTPSNTPFKADTYNLMKDFRKKNAWLFE